MVEHILHPRVIENKDWVTLLFVLSFGIIAVIKTVFESRFIDFMQLIYSDKYLTIYKETAQIKSGFTRAIFVLQALTIAFFLQLTISHFGYAQKTDITQYFQILIALSFFIMAKFLIEKMVAIIFEIEDFMTYFNLHKIVYRSYITFFILPINLLLFHYESISASIYWTLILIILVLNSLNYIYTIKKYQAVIFSKMFYFILYICAFEMAPYCLLYFWFTSRLA
jgi:Domain of unknown function (DUF4271)